MNIPLFCWFRARTKRRRYPPLAGLLLMWGASSLGAQSPLSLEDCIDLARRRNLQHLSERQNLDRNYARLQQARAPFELQADLNLTVPSFNETSDLFDNPALVARFREQNTNFLYRSNLQVSQRVSHLGRFTLTGRGERQDFSSNRRQDFVNFSGDLVFGYSQEVFTQPQEELSLRRARLDLMGARLDFERRELLLESRTTEAYYNLVRSIRQLEIQQQRLEQSSAALDLAQRKFEIGLIAEVEALRLQVEKLEAQASFAQTQTTIERQRDLLREVLRLEPEAPLEIVTRVEDYQKYSIDMKRALQVGLARRTDLKQAEINQKISKLDLKIARRRNGPIATINARVGLRGQGEDFKDISRDFQRNDTFVSIDLSMPLLDGGTRRSDIQQAQIALEQSRLNRESLHQSMVTEIRNAVRNLKEAERQIDLRQAALKVAERTFEVEQSRFELGLADSQDLLNAQTDLTSARTNALDSIIDYQIQLKNLRVATMAPLSELSAPAAE